MNPNMTQSLVSDHIRESRQRAATARRAAVARNATRNATRHAAREADTRAARRGHRLVRAA